MSEGVKSFQTLNRLVDRIRDDLNNEDIVLLYAYNRTGKTRLSMGFKDRCKNKNGGKPNTLYFNAFTEDLFTWENDLENDSQRGLKINEYSRFFEGFSSLDLEPTIAMYLDRYADFKFNIEYKEIQKGEESFSRPHFITFRKETFKKSRDKGEKGKEEKEDNEDENIKISRGEEIIFVWCIFMAICERVIDGHEAYGWVKYIYIDDPISSLDDNNAIAVACDLSELLRKAVKRVNESKTSDPLKIVVSTHHSLFFNVMCNEIGRKKGVEKGINHKRYFLHRPNGEGSYTLRSTEDTPFFHHVATLAELHKAADPESGILYTFHFNALRTIMEKTAAFFGHSKISFCLAALDNQENEALFNRALNLLSHGAYAVHEPTPMGEDNQDLFRKILRQFTTTFQFTLPKIFGEKIGEN